MKNILFVTFISVFWIYISQFNINFIYYYLIETHIFHLIGQIMLIIISGVISYIIYATIQFFLISHYVIITFKTQKIPSYLIGYPIELYSDKIVKLKDEFKRLNLELKLICGIESKKIKKLITTLEYEEYILYYLNRWIENESHSIWKQKWDGSAIRDLDDFKNEIIGFSYKITDQIFLCEFANKTLYFRDEHHKTSFNEYIKKNSIKLDVICSTYYE